MKIPIEQQKAFITEYEKQRPDFVAYAQFMDTVLSKAADKLSLLAIVQSRPKGIVSFSNKIILKDKYRNPLTDMTDLCGARVIVHFQSQVEKLCDFIKENFEIDEANSLDLKSRLKVNEFGYRSVHYIVTPKNADILGIPVDPRFQSMKAEIQVRTLAEHIWADISHDRIYKTNLNIPDAWRREAAMLAAMLENADKMFEQISQEIDSASALYELQHIKSKAETDIITLSSLIEVMDYDNDECVSNSLKLAAIYSLQDEYPQASDLLSRMLTKLVKSPLLKLRLAFEHGIAVALSDSTEAQTSSIRAGIKIIEEALKQLDDQDISFKSENAAEISNIHYRYGKLLQCKGEHSGSDTKCFNAAYTLQPHNPLYLVALIESIILRNVDSPSSNLNLYRAQLKQAIPLIESLIELGIKHVPAYFAIGHCYLFLDDSENCLKAYVNAVKAILDNNLLTDVYSIEAELELLVRLQANYPHKAELLIQFVSLALYLRMGNHRSTIKWKTRLTNCRLRTDTPQLPVLIIAGGASDMTDGKTTGYENIFRELMFDFAGTILCGGTTSGIPGLVGMIKAEQEKNSRLAYELIAYLPGKLPQNAIISSAYDKIYHSDFEGFSAQVIVSWVDLILSGVKPAEVLLIGVDGGKVAELEYRIALAMGATVGLINYSGRAVSQILQDPQWNSHPHLLQLPNDTYTAWALYKQSVPSSLSLEQIEFLAPYVHEHYRQDALDSFDPLTAGDDMNKLKVMLAWEMLDKGLQESNRRQVAFYEHILRRGGIGIRVADQPADFDLQTELGMDYELLAKLEHARWNAERLLAGWKYDSAKDIARKLNPSIVAWENLSSDIRIFDYRAVESIPGFLKLIGYELYKL